MKAFLDEGHPFISIESPCSSCADVFLLKLCKIFRLQHLLSYHLHEKINLVLERDANVNIRDGSGRTCLHIALDFQIGPLFSFRNPKKVHNELLFKDILMSMITAGADVMASDNYGRTVSETACRNGHEEVWVEVLAACGYDPQQVYNILEHFGNYEEYPGLNCFPAVVPVVRSTRLSFAEYCQQRKLLDCVKYAECYERHRFRMMYCQFLGTIEEDFNDEGDHWRVVTEDFDEAKGQLVIGIRSDFSGRTLRSTCKHDWYRVDPAFQVRKQSSGQVLV